MRKELTQSKLGQLQVLKGKLLLIKDKIMVIKDFTIETETVTPKKTFFNRHPKPYEIVYLTGIEIWGYNSEGKFWGTMDEDYCSLFIRIYNLYYLREQWEKLKESLALLDFEVVHKSKVKEEVEPK